MSIPGAASPLFLSAAAAADAAGYQIDRSLRFNSADSAYLGKTFSSAGSTTTWTLSFWIKRVKSSGTQNVFMSYNGSSIAEADYANIEFNNSDQLSVGYAYGAYKRTDRVFRDFSSWYHIVIRLETGNSTASDRVQIYVNGVKETSFASTHDPDSGQSLAWNKAHIHRIASEYNQFYANCYLAEMHFVDGTAHNADSFGEFDDNNVWQPKDCQSSLTYGTNGFYLKFADNSSNAALGTDSSGNSNTWTVNNLQAAGSAWNQSQTWSSGLSALSGSSLTNPPNGFDGDVDSYADSTAGFSLDLSGHTFGTGSHSIKVKSGGATSFSVNGSTSLNDPGGGGAKVWTGTHTGEITSITSSATGASVYFVKIDDLLLVDDGVIDTAAKNIDSLIDTPTNYTADSGNPGGNYATWSPLVAQSSGSITLSNGNLDTTCGSTRTTAMSNFPLTGKTYWEVTFGSGTYNYIGMTEATGFNTVANNNSGIKYTGYQSYSYGWSSSDGNLYKASNILSSSPGTYSNGDVIGWAYDADNNTLKLYKNGTLQHTETGIADAQYFPAITHSGTATASTNFGQRPFAYTPPTDHLALCTTNLPDPTIADGSTAFDTTLYSGNDTQRDITGLGFSPDLVWIKKRQSGNHSLMDTVRGATKNLVPNDTQSEGTETGYLNAFLSDGFSIGTSGVVNDGSSTYVAWAWDGGTSTVSNTDGSITSSVRANPSAGFSIVTYDDGTTNGTVGHGLNAAPDFIVCKSRDVSVVWPTYHSALTRNNYVPLNDNGPSYTVSNLWGTAEPTSSVFGVGTQNSDGNNDGQLVAYCWTAVDQYSSFDSYEGNGSADGPFVALSFQPALIIIKNVDNYGSGYDWFIFDTKRDTFNVAENQLKANLNAAEVDSDSIDILSNGFKIRTTANGLNLNNHTHIYAAFAEHPQKTARAR
jgi:hypothetical protein